MFAQIDQRIARAGRKAALGMASIVCIAIGAGFLTLAAWIWLTILAGPLVASSVIGCVYVGFGFIFLGFARLNDSPAVSAPKPQPAVDEAANPPAMPPLMAAFIHGMQAGARSQSK